MPARTATTGKSADDLWRRPDAARPTRGKALGMNDEYTDTSEYLVEARDVHKVYDTGKVKVHALNGVDLAVGRGEMVAIMGPSGCGKTTLLNCLSGLDAVDEGDVLIEGTSLRVHVGQRAHGLPRAAAWASSSSSTTCMPVLNAVENVELPLLVARRSQKEARERALAALELVGLTERAHHLPDELSGGQRQRVTIARALVNDPAVVWADEPTGDLDSESAGEIVDAHAPPQRRARADVPDRHS